jgi:hypothetical protein
MSETPAMSSARPAKTATDAWLVFGCVIVAIYCLVLYLPASQANIRAHDFLDVVYNYYVLRAGSEDWFMNFDARLGALNGLPVSSLGLGDFSLPVMLFEILPPFEALVVLLGLLRLGGFIGLYLLLRDYILKDLERVPVISLVVALSFVFLAHMPSRFGNILLLPLLIWALFNLWNNKRAMISTLICMGFPFVWLFIYGGYVIAVGIGLVMVTAYIFRASGRHMLLKMTVGFGVVTLITEARLFSHILFKPFESYRTGATFSDWSDSLGQLFVKHLLFDANGHHTVGQFPVLVAVVAAAVFYLIVVGTRKSLGETGKDVALRDIRLVVRNRLLIAILATALVSLLWAALRLYQPFLAIHLNFPHRLDRIDIFSPVLWRINVALALSVLALARPRFIRQIVFGICLMGVGLFALQQQAYELKSTVAKVLGAPPYASLRAIAQTALTGRKFSESEVRFYSREGYPRLENFFRVEAFRRMEEAIAALGDKKNYRVVAIDLSPALLHFHGFQTLGGYFFEHAGSYGDDFAKMFLPELRKKHGEKASSVRFAKGIYAPVDNSSRKPAGLDVDLDMCIFRASGGALVFTPEPLLSATRLKLELLTSVEGLEPRVRFAAGFRYYDNLYVYKLKTDVAEKDAETAGCPSTEAGLKHP